MAKLHNLILSSVVILLYLTPSVALLNFKYSIAIFHSDPSPALVFMFGFSSAFIAGILTTTFFKAALYLASIQTNYLSQQVAVTARMPSLLHNIFGASYLFLTLLSLISKYFKWQCL